MTDYADEFASIDADSRGRELVTAGRYRLPNRDGSERKGGWMRATNLAGAISDQRALQDWELRTQLWGMRANVEIVDEFLLDRVFDDPEAEAKDVRESLDGYIKRLKTAGKGDLGAQRGTIRHAMVEAEHAGLPVFVRARMRAQLDAYRASLADGGLVALPGMQERTVLNERYGVVGTLDNVVHDQAWAVNRIADLKTFKAFYSWLENVIQFHVYATSDAVLDRTSWTWNDWPVKVDPSVALIAWMPHEHPERADGVGVDLYEVDIWRGEALTRVALQVVEQRAAAKSKRAPWGRPRARSGDVVLLSERWARRVAETQNMAELTAVVAGAKQAGIWEVVEDLARDRYKALRSLSVRV